MSTGPLIGIKVLEMAGLGPGPFAGMMLADAGADVVRVERPGASPAIGPQHHRFDLLNRGKRSLGVDLKDPSATASVLSLVERADVLLEGFRPGVMERLGLGPDVCLERNPRLVYTRITGWGQDGPLARTAGHDLDYIALTGTLHAIGRADSPPPPPLNVIGDFGGGGMLAAFGAMCALVERETSGQGQVIDAAMIDGAGALATMMHGMRAGGMWSDVRGSNMLDGGRPYYDVYESADGRYLALAALEPQFYQAMLGVLDLLDEDLPPQHDTAGWPILAARFAAVIATRTLADWVQRADGLDACIAPALTFTEASQHPHNVARSAFVEVDGIEQPAPAPRFARTPGSIASGPPAAGQHSADVVRDWLGQP